MGSGSILKDERAVLSIVLTFFLEGSPRDNILWSSEVNETMFAAEMINHYIKLQCLKLRVTENRLRLLIRTVSILLCHVARCLEE